jgi:ribosomal protein S18 acetylase RimI-like enzyme
MDRLRTARRRLRHPHPQPGCLLLENVAVLPAAQGRGIGARLLALAEEHAAAPAYPKTRRYSNEAMTENLAHYRRHGLHRNPPRKQDGVHRIYFRKRLDD